MAAAAPGLHSMLFPSSPDPLPLSRFLAVAAIPHFLILLPFPCPSIPPPPVAVSMEGNGSVTAVSLKRSGSPTRPSRSRRSASARRKRVYHPPPSVISPYSRICSMTTSSKCSPKREAHMARLRVPGSGPQKVHGLLSGVRQESCSDQGVPAQRIKAPSHLIDLAFLLMGHLSELAVAGRCNACSLPPRLTLVGLAVLSLQNLMNLHVVVLQPLEAETTVHH